MNPLLAFELPLAAAAGAIAGSFLTVLATRIPPAITSEKPSGAGAILHSLAWPASHCRACESPLGWRDNIPILSYLGLRGRCRACGQSYGAKYLILELASAALAMVAVLALGWTGEAALCFALAAILLALTAIDLEEQLLPDILVAPLLPLGILFQVCYRDGLFSALAGMAAAYLAMWSIGALYKISRGREGLGFGDIKLAAALGAWLGIAAVPFFLLGAFVCGLAVMLPGLLMGKVGSRMALPFGPFLAASAIALLLFPAALPALEALLYAG